MAFFVCVIVAGWLVITYDDIFSRRFSQQAAASQFVCHIVLLSSNNQTCSPKVLLPPIIHLVNLLIQIGFFESVHLNQEIQRKDFQFIRFINQNCSQT